VLLVELAVGLLDVLPGAGRLVLYADRAPRDVGLLELAGELASLDDACVPG
jgi:hypothetical protein